MTADSQARPEIIVKQRQAAMILQGKYFGPLLNMQRGTSPFEAAVVARNARYLEALSAMPWDGFTENTRDVTSRALPSVWTKPVEFGQSIEQFQASVEALVTASGGSDQAQVNLAIENVASNCGGCHDDFRSK